MGSTVGESQRPVQNDQLGGFPDESTAFIERQRGEVAPLGVDEATLGAPSLQPVEGVTDESGGDAGSLSRWCDGETLEVPNFIGTPTDRVPDRAVGCHDSKARASSGGDGFGESIAIESPTVGEGGGVDGEHGGPFARSWPAQPEACGRFGDGPKIVAEDLEAFPFAESGIEEWAEVLLAKGRGEDLAVSGCRQVTNQGVDAGGRRWGDLRRNSDVRNPVLRVPRSDAEAVRAPGDGAESGQRRTWSKRHMSAHTIGRRTLGT